MNRQPTHGRRAPRDARLTQFRGVLEALLESLDATVSVMRRQEGESLPEAVERSAAQLVDRLGTANRLAAGKFVGTPAFVTTSSAIAEAIRRLDAAFVVYRKQIDGGLADREQAVILLDAEIGNVKLDAGRWD